MNLSTALLNQYNQERDKARVILLGSLCSYDNYIDDYACVVMLLFKEFIHELLKFVREKGKISKESAELLKHDDAFLDKDPFQSLFWPNNANARCNDRLTYSESLVNELPMEKINSQYLLEVLLLALHSASDQKLRKHSEQFVLKLQRRFEINSALYEWYDSSFKPLEKVRNRNAELVLGLCLLCLYQTSHNLKYLNSALKIIESNLDFEIPSFCAKLFLMIALTIEQNEVKSLYKNS